MDIDKRIKQEQAKARKRMCDHYGVTETGKAQHTAVVDRDSEGNPKLFGISVKKFWK